MNKIIALIVAIAVISIGVGIIFLTSQEEVDLLEDFSSTNYQQQGGFFSMSFTPNWAVTCRVQGLLEANFDGEWRNVQYSEVEFQPEILFNLVNRFTFEDVSKFRETVSLKCDYDTNILKSFRMDSGRVFFDVRNNDLSASSPGGNVLKQEARNFGIVNLPDNQWVEITSYEYDLAEVDESTLKLQSDGETWFNFIHGLDGEFTGVQLDNNLQHNVLSNNIPFYNSYKVLVQPDQDVGDGSAVNKNLPIEITQILQTITGTYLYNSPDGQNKLLDTTPNQGRQITVTGIMRGWIVEEGSPTITIVSANSSPVKIFMQFDRLVGEDGQFIARYTLPQDSPEGIYTVTMEHFIRDSTSTAKFTVENSGSDDDIIPTDGTEPGTDDVYAEVCINWKVSFKNAGDKNGLICEGVFDKQLQQLSFVNNLGGTESSAIVQSIEVSPLLVFETDSTLSKISTQTSNLKYDTTIDLLGNTIKMPTKSNTGFTPTSSACIGQGDSTECANTGLPLGKTVISSSAIETQIQALPGYDSFEENKFHPATIRIDISGDFNVKHEDGRSFTGLTEGANFVWSTNYLKTSQTVVDGGEQCADGELFVDGECKPVSSSDPCEGLPFLEKLICESGGSGGESEKPEPSSDGSSECPDSYPDSITDYSNGFITECHDGSTFCKFFKNGQEFTGFDRETCAVLSQSDTPSTGGDGGITGGSSGGSSGIGGICSGSLIQCAEGLTDTLDDKSKEIVGLGIIDTIIIIIVLLIVIAIVTKIAKGRKR